MLPPMRQLGGHGQGPSVDDGGDHRIAAGHRVVGEEEDGKARRRDLDRAGHGPFAGELAAAAALQRTSPVAGAGRCGWIRCDQPVLAGEPGRPPRRTSPRAGRDMSSTVTPVAAGNRGCELGGLPRLPGRPAPPAGALPGGQGGRADAGHRVGGPAAEHRGGASAAPDGHVAAQARSGHAEGEDFAVEQGKGCVLGTGPAGSGSPVLGRRRDLTVPTRAPATARTWSPCGLQAEAARQVFDDGRRGALPTSRLACRARRRSERTGGGDPQVALSVAARGPGPGTAGRRRAPPSPAAAGIRGRPSAARASAGEPSDGGRPARGQPCDADASRTAVKRTRSPGRSARASAVEVPHAGAVWPISCQPPGNGADRPRKSAGQGHGAGRHRGAGGVPAGNLQGWFSVDQVAEPGGEAAEGRGPQLAGVGGDHALGAQAGQRPTSARSSPSYTASIPPGAAGCGRRRRSIPEAAAADASGGRRRGDADHHGFGRGEDVDLAGQRSPPAAGPAARARPGARSVRRAPRGCPGPHGFHAMHGFTCCGHLVLRIGCWSDAGVAVTRPWWPRRSAQANAARLTPAR